MNDAPWLTPALVHHAQALCQSFQYWLHRPLIPDLSPQRSAPELAQALFTFPNPILSHGGQADPIFNYGNQAALNLWELQWDELITMPSRLSAEPQVQTDRATSLQKVLETGFMENYSGIRISRTGRRFEIKNVIIWTVFNAAKTPIGQAATFDRWDYLT